MPRSVALLLFASLIATGVQFSFIPKLRGSASFQALEQANVTSARAVEKGLILGFTSGIPVVLLTFLHLLEAHDWLPRRKKRAALPPPWPFDPHVSAIVLGQIHNRDGSPCERPGWMVLPEAGLYTGMLVVGATGRGKTSGVLYPLLRQILAWHPDLRHRRPAAFIIDAKGNMGNDVRTMLRECGREDDYYELSIPTARYNVLNRPDLSAAALGGHVHDLISNVTGGFTYDSFWPTAAKELAVQAIRLLRLAKPDPPTMADLYRLAASVDAFERLLESVARRRDLTDAETEELESLQKWVKDTLARMAPHTRANVAANLNSLCSLFDEPEIRRSFCPTAAEETFRGFDALVDQGKVVVLSLPKARWKVVSDVIATAVKLNFQDAILGRLARASTANADVGRPVLFMADEYANYVTAPGDSDFLSQCREARCMSIVAVQSYESFAAKLRNKATVEVLLANLATKVWLGLEDVPTALAAADLCGKVERIKETVSLSEGLQRAAFSFADGQAVAEGTSTAGASTSWTPRFEHRFAPDFFTTSLQTFFAVVKAFDGWRTLPVCVVRLPEPCRQRSGESAPPP